MSTAIDFAVRDAAGGLQNGIVAAPDGGSFIQVGTGDTISLNLSPASVASYRQVDGDLVIDLIDGRSVVLKGWFDQPAGLQTLYLSSDGMMDQVTLMPTGDGVFAADYVPVNTFAEKWSPLDGLRHDEPDLLAASLGQTDEPAGMGLFAPALLGAGGSGLAAGGLLLGAAALGGGGGSGGTGTTTGEPGGGTGGGGTGGGGTGGGGTGGGGGGTGGGGGGGGGTTPPILPTVNGTGTVSSLTTNSADPNIRVSGTGAAGDRVTVVIGDKTQSTTIGTDGKWSVSFPETGLPRDGNHTATVTVGHQGGGSTNLTGPGFAIDMTRPAVAVSEGTQGAGDVENLAEWQDGVTLGGTGEAGAKIDVTVAGSTQSTVVESDGTWTVTFPKDAVPGGERTHAVTVTATDAAGNRTTISDVLVMDTIPNPLSIAAVGGDNRLNQFEVTAPVTIDGNTAPNATVEITVEGIAGSFTRTADATGAWTLTLPANSFGPGTYDRDITVTTRDAAGNPSSATRTIFIDTENAVAFSGVATHPVLSDGFVNLAESGRGLTLSGTAEPGSQWVRVAWLGGDMPAAVDAQGNWSITLPAGSAGTISRNSTITVTSMDAAGNPAVARLPVRIDLEAVVTPELQPVGPDGILNVAERAAGVILDGKADPFSRVEVRVNGTSVGFVTANADGDWSMQLTSANLPQGASGSATISVQATDPAGNLSGWVDRRFDVDTVAPNSPAPTLDLGLGNELNGVATVSEPGTLTYHSVAATGAATALTTGPESVIPVNVDGTNVQSDFVVFTNGSVPDGSYLVIGARDLAGNEASTLYVRSTNPTAVDLSREGLRGFDIAAVDLSSADASLTITEQQILALTGPDKTLVIRGEAGDSVTMAGAVDTHTTQTIGSHVYGVYTLGSATVLVDTDIQKNGVV